MSKVDKIKVGETTYDILQSANAEFTGTSGDTNTSSATTWDTTYDTNPIASTETNSSIFTKVSTMIKNIRFLYNQLGTTDYSATGASTVSAALAALQSGKAASSHSHTVADLPVSSEQVNSSDKIPTSDLIYSMNTAINSSVQSVSTSGSGNAVTSGSISGTALTLTKGATYVPSSGGTFSGAITVSSGNINLSKGAGGAIYINGGSSSTAQVNNYLVIGNNTAVGTAGNSRGGIRLYGTGAYYIAALPSTTAGTANVTYTLPHVGGTVAVCSLSGTTLTINSTI